MDLDRYSKNIWDFFGIPSINMWLTHMLFYMVFAESFVFRNVCVIFMVLVILSVISSYLINLAYSPLVRFVDRKIKL